MTLSLVNGRHHGWIGTEYIGRAAGFYKALPGSPLANPFKANNHSKTEHCRVVNLYTSWLADLVKGKDWHVCNELQRLLNQHKDGVDVKLSCWCTPLPCHGDVVMELLLEYYENSKDFVKL